MQTTPAVQKNKVLTPEKAQVAFFDRPVALAAARASPTPAALIVMLSSDPWRMVIGSDSPKFALYNDGTTIFQTKAGLASVKLDRAHRDKLIGAFDRPELAKLSGRYEAVNATDQSDNSLLIYGQSVPFYIDVYGRLEDEKVRSKLPQQVSSAFDQIRNFSSPTARPWLPSEVEVMVWPYDYAPDQSIVWPKRWPSLQSPTTRRRGDGYSIFLPSPELAALNTFLATRKAKGAVEIEGKKWAVSIRLPFPHEALWMAPRTK